MILAFIGTTELLLIGGLALLLVGGKKLPEMMRGLGKGIREFKDGMQDQTSENSNQKQDEEAKRESTLNPESQSNNHSEK